MPTSDLMTRTVFHIIMDIGTYSTNHILGPVHGLKSWNHMRSKDLVHWENLGIGLNPDFEYDKNGAYSGSALQVGNKLFIMYNGNSRDANWVRHPYQLGAWMDEKNRIENSLNH